MAVPALPARSRTAIALAIGCIAVSSVELIWVHQPHPLVLLGSFVASAFLADVVTAFFHFGFDYVFPWNMPVLGPISREFNEHHDAPTLDPSNHVANLTKGAYASLLASLAVLVADLLLGDGLAATVIQATLVWLTLWTLFFHQMHSYAHMGSSLRPELFQRTIAEIATIESRREQRRLLRKLFETVPIPPAIRLLQKLGLTLDPVRHNLHHVAFERDFSSVNGWSDPLLNPLFGPWARRVKAQRAAAIAPLASEARRLAP